MGRWRGFRNSIALLALVTATLQPVVVEAENESAAARPYYLLFGSSIDRLTAACDVVFQSVGRPDLGTSLTDRLKAYRNFGGIDRTKPVGLMSVWNNAGSADIVFLPVEEIEELLKTATFGVVGYHSAGPNRYEIERPGSPYQVLIRKDYAFLADEVSTIQGIRPTPAQLTRGLSDRFDLVLHLDLKQLPQSAKKKLTDHLHELIEPWLQPQDNEPSETARLRRTVGGLALSLMQRAVLDTAAGTVGCRLDPKTRHVSIDMELEAIEGSPMAVSLNRWISQRSAFTSLVSSEVPAGIAFNLPLSGLVEQVLEISGAAETKNSRLDAGLQLAGQGLGKLSLIAALSGADAIELNKAAPDLMMKLEKSGRFLAVNESFDIHRGILFHSVTPREMPSSVTYLVGVEPEVIIGQGKKTMWLAIGQPESVLDHLRQAIDMVDESSVDPSAAPILRARFQARQLPELVTPDLLILNVDQETTKAAFAAGQDGFTLTIAPIRNGINVQFEAEEGLVRLVGREWIKQIENSTP